MCLLRVRQLIVSAEKGGKGCSRAFDNLIWPTFDTFIWPTLRP